MTNDQHRILELDALRGLAALAVVSFHFTCRFDGLFGHATPLRFSVPLGEYGVDFFFILSGFVILMTLDRTASAGEFAVGRFARLYPAYWAAAALTFAVVQCCGLPGQAVSVGEAVVNATMLQHLLGAPHIDGAYWSLEVELLFYGAILALDRAGALRVTHWPATLAIWLALATAAQFAVNQPPPATLMEPTWPFGLVTKLQTALSLKYLHLFAIGIVLYRVRCAGGRSRVAWLILIWCVELQVLADSWLAAGLVVLMTVVLRAAVDGRLKFLAAPPLVFVGSISYPLYLIHQNIGYVVLGKLERAGLDASFAVAAATAVALLLAAVLSRVMERPATAAIKGWYRSHSNTGTVLGVSSGQS